MTVLGRQMGKETVLCSRLVAKRAVVGLVSQGNNNMYNECYGDCKSWEYALLQYIKIICQINMFEKNLAVFAQDLVLMMK